MCLKKKPNSYSPDSNLSQQNSLFNFQKSWVKLVASYALTPVFIFITWIQVYDNSNNSHVFR